MRTILIPTDFSSTPLLLLKHAALSSHEKLDVIFMYSTFVSDSITDLLFYSPQKILQDAIPQEFREGCSIMQNKYPDKIMNIRYEIFHGNSIRAFEILTELNKVDQVIIATDQPFKLKRNEFNPIKLILRSTAQIEEVMMQPGTRIAEKDLIAQLLTS
jgi:hypothetical protein